MPQLLLQFYQIDGVHLWRTIFSQPFSQIERDCKSTLQSFGIAAKVLYTKKVALAVIAAYTTGFPVPVYVIDTASIGSFDLRLQPFPDWYKVAPQIIRQRRIVERNFQPIENVCEIFRHCLPPALPIRRQRKLRMPLREFQLNLPLEQFSHQQNNFHLNFSSPFGSAA